MRKKDVLIIGAGGVAHVAAHKVAQNNDILGDLCIASRTLSCHLLNQADPISSFLAKCR